MPLKWNGRKRVARGPLARLFRAALYVVALLFVAWAFVVIRHAPPLWYLLENNQDRHAFYAAFQSCEDASIATKHSTVEGDPIYTYGEILGQDERGCRMRIKADYSADKFGGARMLNVDTYCYSLRIELNSDRRYPDILIASNCEGTSREVWL